MRLANHSYTCSEVEISEGLGGGRNSITHVDNPGFALVVNKLFIAKYPPSRAHTFVQYIFYCTLGSLFFT